VFFAFLFCRFFAFLSVIPAGNLLLAFLSVIPAGNLLLLFFLSFPQGICCCFSFCHSHRESAFAFLSVIPAGNLLLAIGTLIKRSRYQPAQA
jgi:hypothetical protein